MNFLKRKIREFIYGEDATSETLLNFLSARGASIGVGVKVYAPNKTLIDKTAPYLLTIGDYVRIAEGVKILTHDYSWSVLKRCEAVEGGAGQILGSQAPVRIGNNVFIGMNAVITGGVTVGDNVIIGAGSVVTHDCESDSVYVGVPARRIMSIHEFYRRRRDAQLSEAGAVAREYKKKFGVNPPESVLSEYFMLFCDVDRAVGCDSFSAQMQTSGNYDATLSYLSEHRPEFESYSAFLEYCFSDGGDAE